MPVERGRGNFGAVGEYTNGRAEGENFGVSGVAAFARLRCLAFSRVYSRCINCFLVSQIEGVGGVVIVVVVGVVIGGVVVVVGVVIKGVVVVVGVVIEEIDDMVIVVVVGVIVGEVVVVGVVVVVVEV